MKMGIRNLKSYIDQYFHGWHHKAKFTGLLVVDGNMIKHKIMIDWSHGGQFGEFREAIIRFYKPLQESGITPIVVLDGIDYSGDKWDTIITRKGQHIERLHKYLSDPNRKDHARGQGVAPSLSVDVYVHVLNELELEVLVADDDADSIAVEVANFYGCPVLSDDSDFFLFRLKGGYIPLDKMKLDYSCRSYSVDIYYYQEFCSDFFRDESMRLIIPALVGNDTMATVAENHDYKTFIDRKVGLNGMNEKFLRSVIRYLHLFYSMETFIERIDNFPYLSDNDKRMLTNNCEKSRQLYDSDATLEPAKLKTRDICGKVLPLWFVESYRAGRISKSLVSAIFLKKYLFDTVDDTTQESSVLVSRPIRQHIYGIIGHDSVKEIFRVKQELTDRKFTSESVTAVKVIGDRSIPSLDKISSLSDDDRTSIFYSIMKCQSVLGEVEDGLKLVMAATVFWHKELQPPEHLVRSLLLCIFICFYYPELHQKRGFCTSIHNSDGFRNGPEWLTNFHYFAQWQCCFKDAIRLNQVLMCPVAFTSPALLYNGRLAMHLTESDNLDKMVDSFHIDKDKYHKLCSVVLKP